MVIEEAKALKKYILCTNTATREALINYSKYSKLVDNNNEGIEEAIKFAIKNKNRIRDLDVDYIYDNNKIINKIDKVLQDNKKHPDRVSIIENK